MMTFRSWFFGSLICAGFYAGSTLGAAAQPAPQPDFSGIWTRGPAVQARYFDPEEGPGPVRNLTPPAADAGGGAGGRYQGDDSSPILQPWAAEIVRQRAAADRAGQPELPAQQLCRPHGVPFILQLNDGVQFLQSSDYFVILYAREMRARIVYLNAVHPDDLEPSIYGHSVGHWEGDTLVVDTEGQTGDTWADRLGTPHTEQIHVVERYRRVAADTIRVDFAVEDPEAFTTPWRGYVTYTPEDGYYEQVCAENNLDTLTGLPQPIPEDTTPDF